MLERPGPKEPLWRESISRPAGSSNLPRARPDSRTTDDSGTNGLLVAHQIIPERLLDSSIQGVDMLLEVHG